MNLNNLKEFIDGLLENPEGNTNIEEVMEKSLKMYRELSEMFLHASPEEREAITEALTEIGKSFETKFEDLSTKMGMTKEELLQAMQDPSNYSPEVLASVQNFQKEVDQEKRSLSQKVNTDLPINKPKIKKSTLKVFA